MNSKASVSGAHDDGFVTLGRRLHFGEIYLERAVSSSGQ